MSIKYSDYIVDGELAYVEVLIDDELILVQPDPDGWSWRGANWTSHIKSYGPYRTKVEAIEAARKVVEHDKARS